MQTIELIGAQLKAVLEQQWQPAGSLRPFLQTRIVEESDLYFNPEAAVGQQVSLSTAGWDLTSLGSPADTQLQIYLGDRQLRTAPVSEGGTAIAFTVRRITVAMELSPSPVLDIFRTGNTTL